MEKLRKEDIYINLQGKSIEELTELQNTLITFNEPTYRKDFKTFYKEIGDFYLGLDEEEELWITNIEIINRQEVTIQQLKEILQPMGYKEEQLRKEAEERGFLTQGNEFYSCFDDGNKIRVIKPYSSILKINLYLDNDGYLRYKDGLNNKYNERVCSNPAIYKDGVWAEIKNNNLTLEQQLEKAKAEVKMLKKDIEEESKPKIGDWVNSDGVIFKFNIHLQGCFKKITNQQLIELLEKETK